MTIHPNGQSENPDEKQLREYAWLRLYSIDFDTAKHVIKLIREITDGRVRVFLVKYLVIAYIRPFSTNHGPGGEKHKLTAESLVPVEMMALHKELYDLRHERFAHTDFERYKPRFSQWYLEKGYMYPMSFKGFDYMTLVAKLNAIEELVKAVDGNVDAKIGEMEEAFEKKSIDKGENMKDDAQKEWTVYTFRKSFKNKSGEIEKEGAYEFRVKTQDGKNWSSEFNMTALKGMPTAGLAEFMKVLKEAQDTWEHVEKLGKPKI